jgi:lipase chaperone LimK
VAAVEESVQAMRRQGATDDEIYRRRAASLSAEAAAQLASMEREEAAWKARVDAYHAEHNRLRNGAANLSAIDQEHALREWRDAHFTMEEQSRLTAHESSGIPRLTLP